MSGNQNLLFSIDDSIASITINRPEAHNAISREMWLKLPELLTRANTAGARVVVVAGSGSSFASGADLSELEKIDNPEAARQFWHAIKQCLEFFRSFELPTIAMINGPCLGGGCLLALACDLRIAGSKASFGIPVARLGIVLDDASIESLVRLIGPAAATELLCLGGTISSGRAEMIGLINQAVEQEALPEMVRLHAEHIAANSAASIAAARKSIRKAIAPSGGDNEDAVLQSYLSEEFKTRITQRLRA